MYLFSAKLEINDNNNNKKKNEEGETQRTGLWSPQEKDFTEED